MNIKSILTYLAALTLSFNVFAIDVQKKPAIATPEQSTSFVKVTLNQESSPDTHLANNINYSHTMPQASSEEPSEFMAALSVYLIIIIVYSIYGFKINSKNVKN